MCLNLSQRVSSSTVMRQQSSRSRRKPTAGTTDSRAAVLRLYSTIRDAITYDPYVNFADPENYRASGVLAFGRGFCIGKSALLAASARAIGVPARVGYADVRNHLTSPRLYDKDQNRYFSLAFIHRALLVGALGQSDARLRSRAVRPCRSQAAGIRWFYGFAFPAVRSGRSAIHGIPTGSWHFCRCAIRHHKSRISYNVSELDERQWLDRRFPIGSRRAGHGPIILAI